MNYIIRLSICLVIVLPVQNRGMSMTMWKTVCTKEKLMVCIMHLVLFCLAPVGVVSSDQSQSLSGRVKVSRILGKCSILTKLQSQLFLPGETFPTWIPS